MVYERLARLSSGLLQILNGKIYRSRTRYQAAEDQRPASLAFGPDVVNERDQISLGEVKAKQFPSVKPADRPRNLVIAQPTVKGVH